ncbi:MAG: hypothetical protein AABZ53_16545 [Planctomycetota bacterium]
MKKRPQYIIAHFLALGITTPSIAKVPLDSPIDPPEVATAETGDLELGPNVGSQPRPARAASGVATPKEGTAEVPAQAPDSRFHVTLGVDCTTAYFSRGYRFEDSGWIAQPFADVSLDVFRLEDATISFTMGTWNSFHGEATGAVSADGFTRTWYESDLYAGVSVAVGSWEFAARYYAESSPSNAWATIEEVYLSVAFDDSDLLGDWSLSPTANVVIETGSDSIDGGRKGTYLQLGVSPGLSFELGTMKDLRWSFPVSVGLSLSNYYEGASGENDVFGFASVGTTLSVPLNLDKSWGVWTLKAGVQGLFLGDATSTFNNGDHTELIGTIGVSLEF